MLIKVRDGKMKLQDFVTIIEKNISNEFNEEILSDVFNYTDKCLK
jgi:hypothetical protein